ncbi:MAG: toxin-antitoxin system HicB family antitoxin [Synergistales bacterium]|nr:toxin-antitoxin system HicB family antitoxin [Dethiosulfovibrio sp.]NCC95609.1 toxin-antitoxin system HicB family antitoxin [Synergistales bacterium]
MAVQFSVRIPDESHAKLRVMAAFKDVSLNTLVAEALEKEINSWEEKHGPLPQPPADID